MIVTKRGMGCGGRGSVGRASVRRAGWRKTCERSNGAQTNEVVAYGKIVWSWHPLLMSNRRRRVGPTGLRQTISVDDGDKNEFVAGESTTKP